jgi:protocatechuate 3,4-dioxygenase beta subunit
MFYRITINFLISSLCLIVFFSQKISLANTPEDVLMKYQTVPPMIDYYPYSDFSFDDVRIKWQTFNNLRRKIGSPFYAIGEPLFVEGYVKDINDVPIDNVQVRLIQANANGAYNHFLENDDALFDPNFAGNGVTYTDNRGYYRFLTVFPGYYNNRAPHLHVVFEHSKYGRIETEIFFENHPRNITDPKYKKLTLKQKKNVTGTVIFIDAKEKELGKKVFFDITFNTNQTTKTL